MEGFIVSTIVALSDPVRVGIVLAIIWFWRSPWAIVAAIVASAVTVDALLVAARVMRGSPWGTAIVAGPIASAIQAVLIYRLASMWARTAESVTTESSVAHNPVSRLLTAIRPLTAKKLIFKLFALAYFGALLLAYLALFSLLVDTAYSVYLIETSGWR